MLNIHINPFISWMVLAFNTFMPDGNKKLYTYTIQQLKDAGLIFSGILVPPIMKGLIRFMFMASL